MDVREQLRRYLEQRKELGESELVLDSMTVEDVLRLVGAAGAASTRAPGRSPSSNAGDWRAALREPVSGASPRDLGQPVVTPPSTADVPRTPPTENVAMATSQSPAQADIPHEALAPGLSVGSPAHELFGSSGSPWSSLADIASAVASCSLCPLASGAKNPVPGEGNPNADLVCVGEAPGATEDELGRPFVGKAGQLLTKILAAIDLSREDVFICNVLKHRPPGNRNPIPDEVKACSPYLVRQIELLKPRVILALGTFAAQTLLQTKEPIGKLRGRIHRYYGVPVIVTYHPAALLRNPSWKRPTWEDVQLARRLLDRQPPTVGA